MKKSLSLLAALLLSAPLLPAAQPDGPAPEPERLGPIMAAVEALGEDLRSAGAWVFSGGLTPPDSARVARLRDSEVVVTDGPYAEAREHLARLHGAIPPAAPPRPRPIGRSTCSTRVPSPFFHDSPRRLTAS